MLIKHNPRLSAAELALSGFYLRCLIRDINMQEPFDNAPVLGAGRESIFYLLSSYCPLKAQARQPRVLRAFCIAAARPHIRSL